MSYIGNTPTQQNFVAGADQFSGNGSTVAFTLSRSVNTVFDIFVTVANVPQDPFSAYTVSGNTLTFDGAPPSGTNNIDVVYRATNVQTFVPTPGVSTQLGLGSASSPSLTFIGDTNTGIYSPGADTVAIGTGGTEALRVNSSQQVGIGTTSILGNSVLNVAQGVVARNSGATLPYFQTYNSNAGTDLKTWRFGGNSSGALTFETVNDAYSAATGRMTLDASGNFIVGGTTARTRLTLQAGEANAPTLGTASGGAFLGNSNVTYGTLFGTSGSGYGWIQQQRVDGTGTAYDLCLQPSGGSLLVGTTTSSGRITSLSNLFDPTTSAKLTTTAMTTVGGYGGGISIIDGTQGYSLWSQAAGADFYIRRATTTGSYTGGVYISNAAGSWSAASDERLKNIHRPIENAADKLSGLRCVFGEYKDNPGIEHPFLIAQDVQVVFPEVVNQMNDEGHLGMSYTDMVPILVKAIQELNAKVEAQAAEIAALKGNA